MGLIDVLRDIEQMAGQISELGNIPPSEMKKTMAAESNVEVQSDETAQLESFEEMNITDDKQPEIIKTAPSVHSRSFRVDVRNAKLGFIYSEIFAPPLSKRRR